MMRRVLFFLFATASLSAAPQAVVFDFGGVLGFAKREIVSSFMCDSLHLSVEEFRQTKARRDAAFKQGVPEVEFWKQMAQEKGVFLPQDWEEHFNEVMKTAIGIDPEMFVLVDQLKAKQISVALLSNVDACPAHRIRNFGFYEPFAPCLLSCEIGIEKPDPKIYQLLLEKLQVAAEEVVFIDDRPENIAAAKQAGIDGILFESATQVRQALEQRGLL